jgi:hypothetical protein
MCGSDRVAFVDGDNATGVRSPDCYAETQYQQGWKCLDCGCVEGI